ncbi:MAG: hypothetical protein ACOYXA_14490 [Bacteroidota bacterium]
MKLIALKVKLILSAVIMLQLLGCSNDTEEEFDWSNNGVKVEKGRVIAFFPKDSVSEERMNELVDSLNIGIEATLRYMGGPYQWQVFGDRPVTYYFEPGNFVSVTDIEGDIYIPLFRIQSNQAPWLHETMHALLRNKGGNWNERSQVTLYFSMPIWLTEGMAEYLAVKVAAEDSIQKFDLMKSGGYYKVDASCYKSLTENEALLSYMGEPGIPTRLLTNRKEFAPPFYNCACSFAKYLSETYGLNTMLTAISSFQKEMETIESLTGKNMETLRTEWVAKIKPASR